MSDTGGGSSLHAVAQHRVGHQPQDRLNEPPRVHHACRRRGGVAAGGARAAAKPCPKMD